MNKFKVTNTPSFVQFCDDAIKYKRNRQVNIRKVEPLLDPDGLHVMFFHMLHNDVEQMRTGWLVKFADQDEPVELWLDMSFEDYNSIPEVETVDE